MLYVSNAFSLNMLENFPVTCTIEEINIKEVKEMLRFYKWQSSIGHEATAKVLTSLMDIEISYNRVTLKLSLSNDQCIVAQYSGPRLEEGTTVLPKDATIKFFLVK